MIRLIASDLDGTLLNDKHIISDETVRAINHARESGVEFMVVTGRDWGGFTEVADPAGIRCDSVLIGGGETRNSQGKLLCRYPMTYAEVKLVLETVKPYGAIPFLCALDREYIYGTGQDAERFVLNMVRQYHYKGTEQEIYASDSFRGFMNRLTCIEDLDELEHDNIIINKIMVFAGNPETARELMSVLGREESLWAVTSSPSFVEVTDARAQKGRVLKKFIESKGYVMDEVMVLGDSLNDLSMISMEFGATVAMGNAEEEIRQAARYITKSNAENGVAYAIEKLLEGQLEELKR